MNTGPIQAKRDSNRALIQEERLAQASILHALPFDLTIEPGAQCLLRCPFCEQTFEEFDLAREYIKFDNFKKIIDYFHESLQHINLFNWGEPLLHEAILSMVKYAADRQIETVIHSNLNSLPAGFIDEFAQSGLTKLIVSLDGASEESYQKYRRRGSFQKAYEHLRALALRQKETGNHSPKVIWKFLVFRHNQHEMKKAKAMADALGVEIIFSFAVAYGDYISSLEAYSDTNAVEKYCKDYDSPCEQLWRGPLIHADGDVLPCCLVYQKKYVLGNIFQQDFKTIWNNKNYQKLRQVAAGKTLADPSLFCYECRFNPRKKKA